MDFLKDNQQPIKHFYSKLLLFGEHTVNIGSQALAIPFDAFSGHWAYSEDKTLQKNLAAFADYLEDFQKNNPNCFQIDTISFKNELQQGLYFNSNIPQGYGAGSSGALCAAIYAQFGIKKIAKKDLFALKNAFAAMESYFHGKSSGFDPLICYTQKAILIESKNQLKTVKSPKFKANQPITFFLINTQIHRQTEPYVNWFLQQCENPSFKQLCSDQLALFNTQAIQAFLQQEWDIFYDIMLNISTFQLKHLNYMIPSAFLPFWQEGLDKDLFRLKICGAGGGGFLLGFTKNFIETQQYLSGVEVIKLF